MDLIERDIQQLSRHYHTKKRRKLTKLIQSKPSKNKRHHRKKRNTEEEYNVDVDTSTVINVSNVRFSDSELSLLSKGLSFCPKLSQIDKFQLKKDINQFTRRVRLREFFYDQDTTTEHIEMDPFKQKCNWILSTNREPALEMYLTSAKRKVLYTLDHRPHSHPSRDNLTP